MNELSFLDPDAKVKMTLKPVAAVPSDKPSLGLVNRFPADFKGKSVTLTGFVTGADNLERQPAIKVGFETTMPVHNLKFYTSRDLLTQVDADIPREGALAKIECVVENVDPKKGHGILGVKSVEILDKDGKPTKTLKSSEAIVYPTVTAPVAKKPTADKSATTGTPNAEATRRTPTEEKKEDTGNLGMYLGIGGGVGLVAIAFGAFLLLKGKKKTPAAAKKYQRQAEPETIIEEKPRTPKPAPRAAPVAKPKPKGDDNPFANFE